METLLSFLLLSHSNATNRQVKESLEPTSLLSSLGQCKEHCAVKPDAHFILHLFPVCGWDGLLEGSGCPLYCMFESLEEFLKNTNALVH